MIRFVIDRTSTCFQCLALGVTAAALLLSAGCASTASRQKSPQSHATAGASPNANLAGSFEDAVARGDEAWNAGQADMAVYLYIQALSFRPRDIDTLGKLGSIEQAQGNLELAARAFELAANADPGDPRLSGRLGLIQMALGNEDEALKWLRLSVNAGATDWRVLDGLGVIESRGGHYIDALQYCAQAVALAPGQAVPLLHRGEALYGSGNYLLAEDAARGVLRIGNRPDAWRLLGQIQAKRRTYSAAVDSFLQAMDAANAYNTTGKMAMENGDNAMALRFFEKAAFASPVYLTEAQHNAAVARERLSSTVNP